VAHCDYWWLTGKVEWCDLVSGPCKCGGWTESCNLRGRRRGNNHHSSREPRERASLRGRAKVMRQARQDF